MWGSRRIWSTGLANLNAKLTGRDLQPDASGACVCSRHGDPSRLCQASRLLTPPLRWDSELSLQLLPDSFKSRASSEVMMRTGGRSVAPITLRVHVMLVRSEIQPGLGPDRSCTPDGQGKTLIGRQPFCPLLPSLSAGGLKVNVRNPFIIESGMLGRGQSKATSTDA